MTSKKLLLIISLILAIFYIFPPATGYIPYKGALFLSFPFIAFILYPKAFLNKQTFWLITGIVIWGVMLLARNDIQRLSWFQSVIFSWLNCLALSNMFLHKPDAFNLSFFSKTLWWIVLLSIFLSLPLVYKDPMLIRQILSTSYLKEIGAQTALIEMQKKGMVDYAFIHAIPSLFPFLFIYFKKEKVKKYKIGYLLLIILIFFFILRTSFGAAIILSTLTLLLSVITTDNKKKNIWLYSIIIIVALPFFSEGFFISLLSKAVPFFDGTIMEVKIDDIIISISTDSKFGQIAGRGDLYDDSWHAFLASPFWGGEGKGGGHAMILDFLAWFGLLGTMPLVLFLYYILKNAYLKIDNNLKIFFFLSLVPYIVLSFVKGTSGFTQLFIISVFIPGMMIKLSERVPFFVKKGVR